MRTRFDLVEVSLFVGLAALVTFSATKASYHLAAGLDYGRGSVRFGFEVGYSAAPKVIQMEGDRSFNFQMAILDTDLED